MEKYRCAKCGGRLNIHKVLGYEAWDFPVDPITGDLEQDSKGIIPVIHFEDTSGEPTKNEIVGITCEFECCEVSDEIVNELMGKHEKTAREYAG